MTPSELAEHKSSPKRLDVVPVFKAMKRGKLPKPLNKVGGTRYYATDIISVSDVHRVVFIWGNGELRTDSKFYGYLFCTLNNNSLYPLMEFHFHPSHKGTHIKVPCKTSTDYTDRFLPGAPELALDKGSDLDPRSEDDRVKLIHAFCKVAGISQGLEGGLWN